MASLKYRLLSILSDDDVSENMLENTFREHYHKDSLRKSLHGLLQNDLVTKAVNGDNRAEYSLTKQGRRLLCENFPFFRNSSERWDGLWRLVIFDIPEKHRAHRDKLRQLLIARGFGLWQSSVWVSPYDHDFFEEPSIILQPGKGRMELFKGLRLSHGDESTAVQEIWGMEHLNNSYAEVYNEWEDGFSGALRDDINVLKSMASKGINNYLNLLLRDPGLPRELLPEPWYREEVSQHIWQWKSFLSL